MELVSGSKLLNKVNADVVNEEIAEEDTPTVFKNEKDLENQNSDITGRFNSEEIEIKFNKQQVGGAEINEEGFLKYPSFSKKKSSGKGIVDYSTLVSPR